MNKINMKDLKIVQYHPTIHREEILKIFSSMPNIFSEREKKCINRETKESANAEQVKLAAIYKGELVGYIGAVLANDSEESWFLDWFAVDGPYQRMGIGTKLLRQVEEKLKEIPKSKLFIETCSCAGELPARNFYEKRGYKKVAVLPDFYSKGHSKVIYFKQLFL